MSIKSSDFNPFYSTKNYGELFLGLSKSQKAVIGCVVALTTLISLPIFAILGIATFRILTRKWSKVDVKDPNHIINKINHLSASLQIPNSFHINFKDHHPKNKLNDLCKMVTQLDLEQLDQKILEYIEDSPQKVKDIYQDCLVIGSELISYEDFLAYIKDSKEENEQPLNENLKNPDILYALIQAKLKVLEKAHLIKIALTIKFDDIEEEFKATRSMLICHVS